MKELVSKNDSREGFDFDQFWEEYKAERMAKYENMSIKEYIAAKKIENEEVDKELIEMGFDQEVVKDD